MAITMAINLDSGIELSQAYFKINKLVFNYLDLPYVDVDVCVFKDVTAYTAGFQELVKFSYRCSGTPFDMYFSENALGALDKTPLSNAYEWLMSMSDYVSAEVV